MSALGKNASPLEIRYGSQVIPFELEFCKRKDLAITVHPDRRVTVAAPEGRSPDEVQKRVWRRRRWIVQQRQYFENFHPLPTPKQYVSGETHLYLGRQYRLKIHVAESVEVKLVGRYL